jgi:hypothetical protein
MNPSPQDLPNAAIVVVSKLIEAAAKVLPSQQEKRGDEKLDKARAITQEFESVISQHDREIIGDIITQ